MPPFEIIDKNHAKIAGITYEFADLSTWDPAELQAVIRDAEAALRRFNEYLLKIGWRQVAEAEPQPGVC